MKTRTKLEYRCDKREEFNYGMSNWYTKYDRSFDMIVTAESEEECKKVMDSYQDAMFEYGIQDSFDSNIEPEFDNKKNAWVGAVEIYVNNDSVSEDKEIIKDFYKAWKEECKMNEKKVEVKEMKKEIKVERIIETTFEDGTSWVEYKVDGKIGYDITADYEEGEEKYIQREYNKSEEKCNELANKKHIEVCSEYLASIIRECNQSENEMWFVEYEDLEDIENKEEFIEKIQEEVATLGLGEYVEFGVDGCEITVYGGVCTQFLF